MEKEEVVFRSRIQDLVRLADRRGCTLYSDFLSLNEQTIVREELQGNHTVRALWYGGYEEAERKQAAFVPEYGEEPSFPITCVRIRPASAKFAEALSHRDILGALMHLGMERSRLGDIAVLDGEALLFCCEPFAEVVVRELTRIRHTTVTCTICDVKELHYAPSVQRVRGSVASVRLDAILSVAFHESRSSLIALIEGGRVFVNGKLVTSNASALKEGDLVSVRGYGRFRFAGTEGTSKKGRTWVQLDLFV